MHQSEKMKSFRLTIGILALLLVLAGCNNSSKDIPINAQTSLPTENTSSVSDNEFSIYLLEGEIAPEDIDIQGTPELEDEPLISIDDIVRYDKATHEIQLTDEGYEKIYKLSIPTNGKAFVVCVNGERIYSGAFWAAYSSLSFDGIIIDPLLVTKENPVIQITLGYPGSSFFQGEDLRSDSRIMQVLEEAGKIK